MKDTKRTFHSYQRARIWLLLLWLLGGLWCGTTEAANVPPSRAHKMVRTWLAENARPMDSRLGNEVKNVETFNDSTGQPIYYVVYLRPNGFVIVPADDEVEPIICFSSEGRYEPSERNPLGALVSRDLPARVDAVRTVQMKTLAGRIAVSLTEDETDVRKSAEKARGKWMKLSPSDGSAAPAPKSAGRLSSISDVRVAPLVQSKWGQSTISGKACYNYYTPPGYEGYPTNYYCGCVATAMAQYMKYREYPNVGVGTEIFTIYVDGVKKSDWLRGGDGSGGPYNWDQMPLVPGSSITETQRRAIGALTHDAGVASGMWYTADWSGAYLDDATNALVDTFYYSNAIFGYRTGNIGTGLNGMVNPNLDNNNPVILCIAGPSVSHAIITDGYGYQSSTLYHHLNMGWSGSSDAWYNLPAINSKYYLFNIVVDAIYNIYISGTGEIISGRVTDVDSGPISGAIVTAERSGGGTYTATTNPQGIYAIANVPSNSTYTMSVAWDGYSFSTQTASTGKSANYKAVSGNCWAINFTGVEAGPIPVASDSNVTADAAVPKTITLMAFDDGLPDPPGALTYIITSLPRQGTLTDPSAGSIGDDNLPYSLSGYGKNVIYTSITNYTGFDSFRFKVNDGGSPPTGGDSNEATIGITVQVPAPEIVYETGFDTGLPAGWTIVDDGNDGYTWRSDNPSEWTFYLTDPFMVVDSDYASDVDMNEQLITHSIDCTNLIDVKLKFKHVFYHWSSEKCDIDVRINGGIWQNVKSYHGANSYGPVELALSSFGADDSCNVQIRWHYYNANWCWYWGIDDVQIIATAAVPIVTVEKCTITAGSKDNTDKISFSGKMRATTYDVCDTNVINITVYSDDINKSLDINFPVDGNTFKKNKYSCSKTDGVVKKSFAYDPKSRKYSFLASNVDLSGLGCPVTIGIAIGDYNALTDVYETIVNGPKVPIPIKLMMGVENVLRVDKCTVKQNNKKANSDQLTAGGAFAVENPDPCMANWITEGLVITLGSQQFTIPKSNLKAGKGIFSCSNVKIKDPNATASATLNFNLCAFTLTIKDANIPTISGAVNFGLTFAGFDEKVPVVLP